MNSAKRSMRIESLQSGLRHDLRALEAMPLSTGTSSDAAAAFLIVHRMAGTLATLQALQVAQEAEQATLQEIADTISRHAEDQTRCEACGGWFDAAECADIKTRTHYLIACRTCRDRIAADQNTETTGDK